jgi:hypothetical protein
MSPRKPLAERVSSKLDRQGEGACWNWLGRRNRDNYGVIDVGGKVMLAHRYMLEQFMGRELRADECACHTCDNRACCNPVHLFAGTKADNNRDMRAKDRHARGERSAHARLTEQQVHQIRARRRAGEHAKLLAAEFGVSDRQVYYLARGQKWAHLGGAK